ncbi:alkylated DNA repair protein alkB homolog 8-like [Homarus americanus]|uniref:Alkylated DNA repair protein alkB 8-like n=1 Tax=Homarus americanus TaxID=6706 RepID=A0A8J5K1J7_HOMAM|nr:alkylated DNA repair protein alkB homolog 8-like [Homarus americanus]XP_042226603.1 alkylated DNA repair protein alkB homolog 8-like [Homarus americanus]XP_042226605.1 alkylated DNA repair protein alkB homolog 8-like [Homarus americanus]XP_042226606.1 alkylated DNA repair protein alkB homolog 8-like [Homarus americanus]KAG7166526.1 Alkylated DNA repair protein alkB 8-like [Homarus americanus]
MENTKRDIYKAQRKIKRCISILQSDMPDIHISHIPTKHVFIANAGLTTNADESSLVELITSIGCGLEALTLIPGKQYSFASFSSCDQAQTVLMAAHGQLDVRGSASPVYMSYVDKVPTDPSPIQFKFPPGLMVVEDFISAKEEIQLMHLIDWGDNPLDSAEGSVLKHRQVRHFGYEFKYSSNSVDKEHPLAQRIPPVMTPIIQRIVEQGYMPVGPDQLTVNRYLPGQGIPSHVDTHSSFMDEILSLSVGGGVNMDFRYVSGNSNEGTKDKPSHYVVYLPPRSLCVMTGPARYEWSHGICPRMTDVVPNKNSTTGLQLLPREERVSFTFRKVRQGECWCQNASVCDSYNKNSKSVPQDEKNKCASPTMLDDRIAAKLEREHVLQVYDQIASHFSVTRHKPWPQVLEFVCSLPRGSMLLDVGCGNGKYMGHNRQVFQVGCDTSSELMKICYARGFEVLTSNCLQLPYRDSLFDAAVCIAVIHHLATEERRLGAIAEIVRVLSIGGHGLIYVWAMEQQRGKKKSTYLKQNKVNRHDTQYEELLLNDDEKLRINEQNMRRKVVCEGQYNERNHDSIKVGTSGASSLPLHINRTEFMQQDMLVPWKLRPLKKKELNCDRRGQYEKEFGTSHRCRDNRLHTNGPSADTLQTTMLDNTVKENGQNKSNRKGLPTETGPDPVFHRFYHVFKQGELEALCTRLNVNIVKSYYDEGNWCIIFEKIS